MDLLLKKTDDAFSPRNIRILCESTHDKNNSKKKYISVRINRRKKTPPVCKGL